MPSYDVSNFPIAIPAIGTLLQVGNGASPELFSSVANIGDITGPTTQVAVVDVTSHTSPAAPYRQKVPTLIDPGTLTIPVYIVPASGAPSPYGPGYRVYFRQRGRDLIILLAGGDKRTQAQNIKTALRLARDLSE